MGNYPPTRGPTGPPRPGMSQIAALHQTLVMTPPIANSEEEAAAQVRNYRRPSRELSDGVMKAVQEYVAREDSQDPYTDGQIWNHLQREGYKEVALRDIPYARQTLGIEGSGLRKGP